MKKRLIPVLRFKEFSDPWTLVKAGELFGSRRKKSKDGNLPFYSVTLDRGLVLRNSLEKKIKRNSKENLVTEKDDIVYNMMRMWQGAMGVTTSAGLVSPAYVVLQPKEGVSSPFYYKLLKTNKYLHTLKAFSYGLTEDRLRLYYKDFAKISLPRTSLPEQQKIVSFLHAIDLKIKYLGQKKALLKQYKKGVMKKIFDHKIKFRDENGKNYPAWTETTLGRCLDYIQPGKYLVQSTEYRDEYKTPVLTAGKSFILGFTNEETGIFNEALPVIIFDDFTTASKYVDFPFKAKSSAMKILAAKDNVEIKFIFELLQTINYEPGNHARQWISTFAKMKVQVPDVPEQKRIAEFSNQLDRKISIVEQQIHHMERFKQSLFQQMFI
jgi:type I restriction enzyme, S subunit